MKVLDPTYLRYVYYGLRSGVVKKEDHTSLPIGHMGIYEELFSESFGLNQRKRLLEFFTAWSILKRDVTAEFVAKIIQWKEEDVLSYINMYSRFFNAISANNYILYHDSLRKFILQYSTEKIIEEIIASLNRLQIDEPNEYCTNYLNDHNFSLSFSNQIYSEKCINYVHDLKIHNLPKSLVEGHHHRAFSYASHLFNYRKDITGLTSLFVSYDRITNSALSIEQEIQNFEVYGIDYVIEKGDTFGNVNISFVYWIYFIEHLMNEDSGFTSSSIIEQLVNHLNKYLLINENIKESLLTIKYIRYINEKLTRSGFSHINYVCKIEGIPSFIYDFGHDEEMSPMNTSYIIDKKIDPQKCLQNLIEHGNYIVAFKLNKVNVVNISQRIIVYILDEKFELLDNFIKKLKIDVLVHPDKPYDDLFNFDKFVFEAFLISIHFKPNQKYIENWMTYFTTNEFGRDMLSFFLMLRKIHLNEDVTTFYRKYYFPSTDITKNTEWVIDEMSTVMYVLSVADRFSEIKHLLSRFLEVVTDLSVYNYHSDLLASEYWNNKGEDRLHEDLYRFYSKNKDSARPNQLSYVLCSKLEFLELISIQLYNANEQSEIGRNYSWACDIIDSIYLRLGDTKFIEYLSTGFDSYISVMGSYYIDEHAIDLLLPEDNVWRIEWWIMTNFYSAIYSSANIKESTKSEIIKNIRSTFQKYSFDSSINLDFGVREYQSFRNQKSKKKEQNFEFLFHKDETHYLRSFSLIQFDKIAINKVSGSIKNNTIYFSYRN